MGSTDKHQTIDDLLNKYDFFDDLPAGTITKTNAKKALKEILEQKRKETQEKTKGLGLYAYYETCTKELDELLKELSL